VENEENGHTVHDLKKTMINVTKELSDIYIKVKEEILEDITKKFMEKILDMVSQNVQEALKKFQDTKIKNMIKHRNK
jgi:tRNA A37 threonylcarbamoyltransferase TsaD